MWLTKILPLARRIWKGFSEQMRFEVVLDRLIKVYRAGKGTSERRNSLGEKQETRAQGSEGLGGGGG